MRMDKNMLCTAARSVRNFYDEGLRPNYGVKSLKAQRTTQYVLQ